LKLAIVGFEGCGSNSLYEYLRYNPKKTREDDFQHHPSAIMLGEKELIRLKNDNWKMVVITRKDKGHHDFKIQDKMFNHHWKFDNIIKKYEKFIYKKYTLEDMKKIKDFPRVRRHD